MTVVPKGRPLDTRPPEHPRRYYLEAGVAIAREFCPVITTAPFDGQKVAVQRRLEAGQ